MTWASKLHLMCIATARFFWQSKNLVWKEQSTTQAMAAILPAVRLLKFHWLQWDLSRLARYKSGTAVWPCSDSEGFFSHIQLPADLKPLIWCCALHKIHPHRQKPTSACLLRSSSPSANWSLHLPAFLHFLLNLLFLVLSRLTYCLM